MDSPALSGFQQKAVETLLDKIDNDRIINSLFIDSKLSLSGAREVLETRMMNNEEENVLRIRNLDKTFNDWCKMGGIKMVDAMKVCRGLRLPFVVRVVVAKDIPPRHAMFTLLTQIGATAKMYNNIFSDKEVFSFIRKAPHMFTFPEKHLSIQEQVEFISTLSKHRDGKKLSQVNILTSSPLIIASAPEKCITTIAFMKNATKYYRFKMDDRRFGYI